MFSTNRAHALDLYLVSMSRYTLSKTWRSFTTPRLHQVKDLYLEHKHTEQDAANATLRNAGQMKNMGDTVSTGADIKVCT